MNKKIIIRNNSEVIGIANHVKEKIYPGKTYKPSNLEGIRIKKRIFRGITYYDPDKDGTKKIPYNNRLLPITKNKVRKGQYRPQGGQPKANHTTKYKLDLFNSILDQTTDKKFIYWDLVEEIFKDKKYLPQLFPSDIKKIIRKNQCFEDVYNFFRNCKDFKPGGFHIPKRFSSDFAVSQIGDFFTGGPFFKRTSEVNIVFRTINQISEIIDSILTCKKRTGLGSCMFNSNKKIDSRLINTIVGVDTIIKNMDNDIGSYFKKYISNICHNNYYINKNPNQIPLTNMEAINLYNITLKEIENGNLTNKAIENLSSINSLIDKKINYLKLIEKYINESKGLVKLKTLPFKNIFNYYVNHSNNLPNIYIIPPNSNKVELNYNFKKELMSIIKSNKNLTNKITDLVEKYNTHLLSYRKADDKDAVDLKGIVVPIKLGDKVKIIYRIKNIIKNHNQKSRKKIEDKIINALLTDTLNVKNKLTIQHIKKSYLERVTFQELHSHLRNFLFNEGYLPVINYHNNQMIPDEIIKLLKFEPVKPLKEHDSVYKAVQVYKEFFQWLSKSCDLRVISIYTLFTNMMINGVKLYIRESIRINNNRIFAEKNQTICKGSENRIKNRIYASKKVKPEHQKEVPKDSIRVELLKLMEEVSLPCNKKNGIAMFIGNLFKGRCYQLRC